MTGNITENKNGTVCLYSLSGSYTVNPDGTGTITLTETPTACEKGTAMVGSVLFNMGKDLVVLNTAGSVTLGALKRQ